MTQRLAPGLPQAGDVLAGKYRVERVVGQGGMGIVYAAHHELLDQRVAIKVLLAHAAANPAATTRFLNEAKVAARLRSEHVCHVTDVGLLEGGLPYIAMDLLDGADLGSVLEARGPLPIDESVEYVLQALEALAHAHALRIVHRDLKPSNLFLTRVADGPPVLKILDFGISKAEGGLTLTSGSLTQSGAILGSPYYMAPEQIRNSRSVDARADIWAMGIVLYELLTARRPFDGETPGELFANILEQPPIPLSALRPDVPRALEAVVLRCLRRDKNERFADVAELAQALGPIAPWAADRVVRICRTAGRAPAGSYASQPPALAFAPASAAPPPMPIPSQTRETWAQSAAGMAHSRRLAITAGSLGVAAFLLFAALVTWRVALRSGPAKTLAHAPAIHAVGFPGALPALPPLVPAQPAPAPPASTPGAGSAKAEPDAGPQARPRAPGAAPIAPAAPLQPAPQPLSPAPRGPNKRDILRDRRD